MTVKRNKMKDAHEPLYQSVDELLALRKEQVDWRLNALLPGSSVVPAKLHRAMRYSVFSGGKRIRPLLAIESALCCGGSVVGALDAACALELVHAFSLIHDDLPAMDDDDMRRGKKTCHKEFDEATAILAGDALLSRAFEVLARERENAVGIKLIRELGAAIGSRGMAGGQALDIEYEKKPKTAALLRYINRYKTGALIRASLRMGAITATAAPARVDALGEFGVLIGEVFQIVDDIMDAGTAGAGKDGTAALRKARALTTRAKQCLAPFRKKADTLRMIADHLVERKQ